MDRADCVKCTFENGSFTARCYWNSKTFTTDLSFSVRVFRIQFTPADRELVEARLQCAPCLAWNNLTCVLLGQVLKYVSDRFLFFCSNLRK